MTTDNLLRECVDTKGEEYISWNMLMGIFEGSHKTKYDAPNTEIHRTYQESVEYHRLYGM